MYCLSTSTGRGALDEHRAQVADERRHHVAALEREAAAHGVGLLPERPEQPADDLGLPVERDEPLLEGAREAHPVVELELLLALRRVDGRRRRGRAGGARGGRALGRGSPVRLRQLCPGSACRWSAVKNFLTFLSRRLSPTWSVCTSTNV
jgi:hypothetical protein